MRGVLGCNNMGLKKRCTYMGPEKVITPKGRYNLGTKKVTCTWAPKGL